MPTEGKWSALLSQDLGGARLFLDEALFCLIRLEEALSLFLAIR